MQLTVTRDSGENTATNSSQHISTQSYTPPVDRPSQSSPHHNRGKTHSSSSSPPPLPTSPYHSPTIRVKRVESTVSQTDQTSYPQVIVHVGRRGHRRSSSSGPAHSRSNSLSDARTAPPSSRQLQRGSKTTSASALHVLESTTFNPLKDSDRALSDLTQELKGTRKVLVSEPLSPAAVPVQAIEEHSQIDSSTDVITDQLLQSENQPILLNGESEEADRGISEDEISLGELIHAELELNRQKFHHELSKSPPLYAQRSPSATSSTPSEVSTIVPRDLALSRCSALSFTEDSSANTNEQTSATSKAEPSTLADSNRNSHAISGTEHPLHSSQRPVNEQELPQNSLEGEPTVEFNGTQTLFRNSPLLDIDTLLNGHQKSVTDQNSEDNSVHFPSLTVSAPSPQPGEPSLSPHSDSARESPPDHTTGESQCADQPPSTSSPSLYHQRRPHPVITSLKEDYRKSFHSSTSSIDSTACSVIEVTYCQPTDSDTSNSSSHQQQQREDFETNTTTSSAYCSSSSENENEVESASYEVVAAETISPYLVDLEAHKSDTSPGTTGTSIPLTRYHSLPNFEQVDLETIPEEMAVTTQVMRIYPAQSVGEISTSVAPAVPHHRVHIPSSSSTNCLDPESPSKNSSDNNATTTMSSMILCTSPATPPAIITESRLEEEPQVPPGLVASATIHILQDGEEEEEDQVTVPVTNQRRKYSAVSTHVYIFSCTLFIMQR